MSGGPCFLIGIVGAHPVSAAIDEWLRRNLLIRYARQRRVDPRERLVAPEHAERLEDPGRHRGARRAPRGSAGRPAWAWPRARRRRPRSAACVFSSVNVVEARQRRVRVGQRGAPVLVEPLLARLRRRRAGPVEDEARQRPEVRQRLHLLARDLDRVAQAAVAGVRLQARGQVVDRQRAQVAAVEPAQLALVELGGVLGDALEAEALDELLGGEDRLVVGVAPAQQREVVAHRLGQVAGVAQLLHGRRAVALGELLAVGPVQQRQVRVDRLRRRRRRAPRRDARRRHRLEHEQLLGRVGEVVLAADDVRDVRVEVVDGDREVVEDAAVGARDDRVVEVDVRERRVAADDVVHDGRALVGHAQAHRALALVARRETRGRRRAAPCRP